MILESANNCSVQAVNSGAIEIQEAFLGSRPQRSDQRVYALKGKQPCTTFLEARDRTGRLYARLEVAVKRIKPWRIKFHFVQDSARHGTRRTPGNLEPHLHGGMTVDQCITAMNQVYLPQAAIEMVSLGTTTDSFPGDLGRMILDRSPSTPAAIPANWGEWDYIASRNDSAADLNVYFVWRVEQSDSTTTNRRRLFRRDSADALTTTPGNTCIFEDDLPANCFVSNLCHETGHSFGCDDSHGSPTHVMYFESVPHSNVLSKAEVQMMNP